MRYCSVTTVLKAYQDFSAIPVDILQAAALRGSAVHAACAAYTQGLFVPPMPEEYRGYYQSFKGWFDQYIDHPIFVEKRLEDTKFRFTGIVDLVAVMIDRRHVVVDYKTPVTQSPWWAGQIAAYRHLVKLVIPDVEFACYSLMLRGNGRPARAVEYQRSDRDFAAFLSALNAYRYFNPERQEDSIDV